MQSFQQQHDSFNQECNARAISRHKNLIFRILNLREAALYSSHSYLVEENDEKINNNSLAADGDGIFIYAR
jgi:hypothetical protein